MSSQQTPVGTKCSVSVSARLTVSSERDCSLLRFFFYAFFFFKSFTLLTHFLLLKLLRFTGRASSFLQFEPFISNTTKQRWIPTCRSGTWPSWSSVTIGVIWTDLCFCAFGKLSTGLCVCVFLLSTKCYFCRTLQHFSSFFFFFRYMVKHKPLLRFWTRCGASSPTHFSNLPLWFKRHLSTTLPSCRELQSQFSTGLRQVPLCSFYYLSSRIF